MAARTHTNGNALDRAREAYESGDYPAALESYSYFFEHALDGDPASFYGVRLSYCLAEWLRLGRKYPPALMALEQRRQESIRRLEATREPEHFHDFECISKHLSVPREAMDRFLAYHRSDPALARTIVRFVWSTLVEAEYWQICNAYLENPSTKYDDALAKLDEATMVARSNPELGGTSFEQQIQGWYVRDVSELVLVLRNCGRLDEAETIQTRAIADLTDRELPQVV